MPRVIFAPSGKSIDVKSGTSLLDAATQAGLPVAASCSAELVCGKCNLQIQDGAENLSKQSEKERGVLRREGRPETDRLSCRTAVFGDCRVSATYW